MKRVGTNEFAAMVGVTPRTIRNWVKSGKITPLYNITGRLFFTAEHYRQAISPPATVSPALIKMKKVE